jgi:glutamate dehydrogenase (NADP+)
MFDQIQAWLDEVQTHLDLTADDITYLTTPTRKESFTITTDNGSYDAHRILANKDRGPGKGGIRYHQTVNEEEVKALSFWMALKTSLADIPFGGAKGGVAVNTNTITDKEKQRISRAYIAELTDAIGVNKDIPAPDMYTDEATMAVMLDEYETRIGHHEPGVITGKPLELGGSHGRSTATADGAYQVFNEHIDGETTVAIQGYGNAGEHLAHRLADDHRVVAVSDSDGGIKDKTGLDPESVSHAKERTGSVTDHDATTITNEELLALDVDVLIPAALGGVITEDNAHTIRANTIIEVANGPVTAAADKALDDVTILPDILANSGGVIVSYYEWVQNRSGDQWTATTVNQRLRDKITTNYHAVKDTKHEHGVSHRIAAYMIATKRILRAASYRGR